MIYLIEEVQLDPMENRVSDAITYKKLGYTKNPKLAEKYRASMFPKTIAESYPLCYADIRQGAHQYIVTELRELREKCVWTWIDSKHYKTDCGATYSHYITGTVYCPNCEELIELNE